MRALLKKYSCNVSWVVDILLPPRCIVSGEIVEKQGVMSSLVWADLTFIAQPQCTCCGVPFDYIREDGAVCAQCLENRPVFSMARAALRYDNASRKMVLGFKHGDKTHAVKTFTPWMKKVSEEFINQVDFLLPVPLHPSRLRKRRYNQAALMMEELSSITGVKGIPDGIKRIRATPSQGHKTVQERKKNVNKAFEVNSKHIEKLHGKKIVLIDDVFTTGATVNECARVLKTSGVSEVFVLTLARVVKDELL